MKIKVFVGKNGDWFWHFKARNGKIVTDAEAFPTKANAIRAAKTVVRSIIGGNVTYFIKEKDEITTITWEL